MTPQLQLIKSNRSNGKPSGLPATGPLRGRIQEFLQIKKRACRPTTLTTYAGVLERYAAFVGDEHWPPTWQGVLDWFDRLEADGVRPATLHSYWLQLRTFLNFLEKIEAITPQANPVRFIHKLEVAPENPDLPPVAFPPEDTDTLLRHLNQVIHSAHREAVRNEAIRNRALLRFAYVTGIREAAIAALPLTALSLPRRCITIPAEFNKSGKIQEVYFDTQVRADLQAWLDIRPRRDDVQNIFVSLRGQVGAAMTGKALYVILQRVCEAAGVPRRKFHALRHSSALDALDVGISIEKVQRQLGHASLATTMKYLRGRDEDRRRAYQEYSLSDSLAKRAAKRRAGLEELDLAG